ncbi:threonine--tRNA ligase [archaeon]|jgi:threonyl-tRNA synthetase|nr:threonine--tRNA ligase [archaeon]MBT4271830.1 threonine--tRNA ligase [archaeon]MBT4460475.1 threonine--tRNA ligase [archaeon]MBT4858495.1 threonine--tRNA ligase [archaeon]MBT5422930.1 threonine--tRNA ligase [archaeon]
MSNTNQSKINSARKSKDFPGIKITLPDGSKKEYKKGVSGYEIAKSIGEGLARASLAVVVDGEVWDLDRPIDKNCNFKILTGKDHEGKKVIWHTAEHILTQAMLNLYPGVLMAMGPATDEGYYFDFDSNKRFSKEDFEKIESEMKKIIKADLPIVRKELSVKEVRKLFKGNKYKQEWLDEIEQNKEKATIYYTGEEFADLCAGPHVRSTSQVGYVKLLSIASAYWRGNSENEQLQRIYGTAFQDKKELKKHLNLLEEAKKRDHRKIGRELDIFEIDEDIGPGLVIWLPKGNIIKEELENWAKETEEKWGYVRVTTPMITKEGLFHTSEHLPHYKDSMFAPMNIDGEKYYIKPMNCPFHHKVFSARPRSYRDLPLRVAEYGTCHRYEQSGAITGLMRVRGMQMNDAHIYCTKEQAVKEFIDVIRLHEYYYKKLGIKEYQMELALRDPSDDKYHGEEEMWVEAEDLMRKAMEKSGVKYKVEQGGAAFYGPKIDFQIKSVIGREFTASTNQIDLFMPGKFNLKYAGKDGKDHVPVVIHRAPLGTHERFIGFLIEHFAGKFPIWLSPVQVRIMTISQKLEKKAQKVVDEFKKAGIRVELDNRAESIPKKVREAQLQKIPIMLTIGDKEIENNTVALRTLDGQVKFGVKVEKLIKKLRENIDDKELKFKF